MSSLAVSTKQTSRDDIEEVQCTIKSILFNHKDSYTLKVRLVDNSVATALIDYNQVLGPTLVESEALILTGRWEHSLTYGDQIITESVKRKPINEASLIVQWLAKNKDIKGVGVRTGAKLHNAFGDELSDVLNEADIDEIHEITEIPYVKIITIIENWKKYRDNLKSIKYLTDKKFPYFLAMHCMHAWGERCEEMIESNPYALSAFMSFIRTDKIVQSRFNINKEDKRRLIACTEDILVTRFMRYGHTVSLVTDVLAKLKEKLGNFVTEVPIDNETIFKVKEDYVQAAGPYFMERYIEERLNGIANQKNTFKREFKAHLFELFTSELIFKLNNKQVEAIKCAVTNPVSIIAGGAGTGSNTGMNEINWVECG